MATTGMARSGYDPAFLGSDVPLPTADRPLTTLDYTHFTVQFDRAARFAAATGVNIDGSSLLDLPRIQKWHLDARVPAADQAGEDVYARNALDRGHLVRRRDPVWGARSVATIANADTFVFTNAAPQVSGFNQSKELWAGLENYVLDFARANRNRISVFTGPVFDPGDRLYRGIRIPAMFWKVAAWQADAGLAATGYVLDQSELLSRIDLSLLAVEPGLGAYRTFQVPIGDIRDLTGLHVDKLIAADRLAPVPAARQAGPRGAWVELSAASDIAL